MASIFKAMAQEILSEDAIQAQVMYSNERRDALFNQRAVGHEKREKENE